MNKIVKAIVRRTDIKYLSGVVLAGFIGSLLTFAVTSGQPIAHAQLAPRTPPFAGLRNVEVVWHSEVRVDTTPVQVNCPTGKIAIGGGSWGNGKVNINHPIGPTISETGDGDTLTPATGWVVSYWDQAGDGSESVIAYAICATP